MFFFVPFLKKSRKIFDIIGRNGVGVEPPPPNSPIISASAKRRQWFVRFFTLHDEVLELESLVILKTQFTRKDFLQHQIGVWQEGEAHLSSTHRHPEWQKIVKSFAQSSEKLCSDESLLSTNEGARSAFWWETLCPTVQNYKIQLFRLSAVCYF